MAANMDAMLRIKADVQGENNIRRLGDSIQRMQSQTKTAAIAFNGLKGAVGGFAAAITGSAIVGGLGAIVKRSVDAGDELFNLQAKTGIAASALIGLGNAAKLADVDQATLGKALTKLSVNLVKAAEGNDTLAQKFKALGVGVKDASGQVVPADRALKQIADRFADMPDGAQKAAAAVALFGRSGADLIPLLNEGAAAMEKFTYKVGDDFAARSDLFNDTITELGIKTQGFGLELTDALLPALQSILEVFGDLFDTKQDWTALFDVIKFGLRTIATIIYATIKLVDQLIKSVVYSFDAIGKALQGDFEAAGRALSQGFGAGLDQAKRDFEQIAKLWSDSPSPGTGRRTGGQEMESPAESGRSRSSGAASGAAAARSAAAEARRAADEQERAAERYNNYLQQGADLANDLTQQIKQIGLETKAIGKTPTQSILLSLEQDYSAITFDQSKLAATFNELVKQTGLRFDGLRSKIQELGAAKIEQAQAKANQSLIELLPSLADYDANIEEVARGKTELTELEKLNAQVNLLQLDILAATNPALAEQIRLLRERAGALDDATKKQEENSNSFGTKFKESFKQAYDAATDLGSNLASIATNGIDGLSNAIVEFATTGKASFKEFAASVLKDLSAMLIKFSIFKAIGALFPGLTGFANGGIMTGDGPVPLKKYASGGIANSPQMAIFGEGSMNEAYVPLPDGRRIPVAMQGGGGNPINVVVNVDAKGSQVEGDQTEGAALGRVISAAVQAELVKQQRPGGILGGGRR